jgi:hypothetical protein
VSFGQRGARLLKQRPRQFPEQVRLPRGQVHQTAFELRKVTLRPPFCFGPAERERFTTDQISPSFRTIAAGNS